MKPIRAVLFDMDGLLLDSERRNMECAAAVAREMGFELDIPSLARVVCGVRRAMAVETYARCLPEWVDAAAFYNRKTELIHERLQTEKLGSMKGAEELLKWLNAHGIACVLATATTRESAEKSLRSVGLWEYLPYRVTGDMVTKSKPDPESYLKAAEAAGASPSHCLVLEDSFNGIRAGRAAGAYVGMVPDTLPYDELCAPYCDAVFSDLTEVIDWIQAD